MLGEVPFNGKTFCLCTGFHHKLGIHLSKTSHAERARLFAHFDGPTADGSGLSNGLAVPSLAHRAPSSWLGKRSPGLALRCIPGFTHSRAASMVCHLCTDLRLPSFNQSTRHITSFSVVCLCLKNESFIYR